MYCAQTLVLPPIQACQTPACLAPPAALASRVPSQPLTAPPRLRPISPLCPAGLQRQVVYGGLRIGLYEPIRNMMVGKDHVGEIERERESLAYQVHISSTYI